MAHVFLSYNHVDVDDAKKLKQDLEASGPTSFCTITPTESEYRFRDTLQKRYPREISRQY